jgi:hypothetical protein
VFEFADVGGAWGGFRHGPHCSPNTPTMKAIEESGLDGSKEGLKA